MGLSFAAYGTLVPIPGAAVDEGGWPVSAEQWKPGSVMESIERDFPGRCEGLNSGTVYTFASREMFDAGPYTVFDDWRNDLACMAGYPSAEAVMISIQAGPFAELICFPDNEGIIGPVVAAKLARDFADYKEKAKAYAADMDGDPEQFLEYYANWRQAFEIAAGGGAVELI